MTDALIVSVPKGLCLSLFDDVVVVRVWNFDVLLVESFLDCLQKVMLHCRCFGRCLCPCECSECYGRVAQCHDSDYDFVCAVLFFGWSSVVFKIWVFLHLITHHADTSVEVFAVCYSHFNKCTCVGFANVTDGYDACVDRTVWNDYSSVLCISDDGVTHSDFCYSSSHSCIKLHEVSYLERCTHNDKYSAYKVGECFL